VRIYLKISNDVEVGIDLNEQEVIDLGAGFAELFTNGDLTTSFMDMCNDLISKTKAEKEQPKEEPEPEKAQEEEDDDPDAERRDELIKDLRDLGYKVTEIDKDAKVKCTTYASDLTKYKFVKSWLKTGEIEYKEDTTCTGRLKMDYELSGSDVIALAKYLEDNEVDRGILV
jgi:hypothetical protein